MQPLESTQSAHGAIQRVRYCHDAMIDIIIAKPDVSQITLAEHFGYTQAWVSRIMCSDAFQARLAARRTEIVDPTLLITFEEKLKALATKSLDLIADKLEELDDKGKPKVGVDTMFKALELSSKSLGYGARQTNVAIQNNLTVNNASDDDLMAIAQGASVG